MTQVEQQQVKQKGKKKVVNAHTHTYLEDAQGFDQAAHLVLQGEHHGRLASLLCVLLVRVLVDGAEGGPPGLDTVQHSHCQLEATPALPSIQ